MNFTCFNDYSWADFSPWAVWISHGPPDLTKALLIRQVPALGGVFTQTQVMQPGKANQVLSHFALFISRLGQPINLVSVGPHWIQV